MRERRYHIVLCEDKLHEVFVRRFLAERYSVGHREIKVVPYPAGSGCGEQYVREKYAKEVQAYRSRHAKTALIVVIDADKLSQVEREKQLENALTQDNQKLRHKDECILHIIPKRNINTWLAFLNGLDAVDEANDYAKQAHYNFSHGESDIQPFVKKLVDCSRKPECSQTSLQSLCAARAELKRLVI